MTQQRLPLPFPISDAADLRRAVKHVSKHDDTDQSRRYVIARAKALGHLDLIPGHWTGAQQRWSGDASLEKQFLEQSHRHDISVARLKTVYFRGVNEFQQNGLEMGSASMWGLVRVQKYINAVKTGDIGLTDDKDLCTVSEAVEQPVDMGIELNVNSNALVMNVIYGDGTDIAGFFKPGVVESYIVEDSLLIVCGTLNDEHWRYRLDTRTGAHDMSFMGS